MAKDRRAARRERRAAAQSGDGHALEPRSTPSEQPDERRGPRHGFVFESIAELRKVEWPGQSQVVQGTVVVLIACVIIGSYLYLADQVFRRFVENVLLGQ